jgi:hypothetical protein
VVDAARVGRVAGRVGRAFLVREDGDQAAVAGVEVQVALRRVVQVGLLEHERHAEQASQTSIDVCRSAPTSVMWWTPWLWVFRTTLNLPPR